MAYKGDLGNGRLNRHISYFRECYEADNRELGLWNVFRDKHWHLYFLDGQEELVTGAMPRVPIDASLAEKASKSQSLYQRERTLLYASYFVVGNVREAGRARSICAPLLHYQAMLQQEREDWYLSIDPADENLNVPLARWLRDRSKQEDNDTMLEPDLGGTTLGKAGPAKIAPWLRALLPDIDCLELFKFPRLCSADTLKKMLESMPAGRLAVYPASALVLVAKSPNTRGILHELSQISAADVSPTALGQILGADSRANKRRSRSDPDEVPGLLNEAQKKALISAADSRVGLVVGPPGTGKSYTIAAMAIDRMAHGETVLVVSNTEQAVDVVGEKINENLGVSDCVVRAGRGDYLREFKQHVDDLLHGVADPSSDKIQMERLSATAKLLHRNLRKFEKKLNKRFRLSLKLGKMLARDAGGGSLLSRFRRRFAAYRVRNTSHPWAHLKQIQEFQGRREKVVSDLIDERHRMRRQAELSANRSTFVSFSKGIRARASSRQQAMFDAVNFHSLLKAFPIWLCSLESLHRVLPLRPEIFDLVIIDEATQCDIASSLPALYRASRAVVVGDPKQLRHVSFLSRDRERRALEANDLTGAELRSFSYREDSILDLVSQSIASQDDIVFLDEHYRGKPQLIQFSNEQFYQSAIRVMSERPDHDSDSPLHVVNVDGSRNARGVNNKEAEAVIEAVSSIIDDDAKSGLHVPHSIGVLSPFREQAAHLARAVEREFSAETIEKHLISVGTAYAFQGEERDIMFLSFTVDGKTAGGSIAYLNRADVFNVAITRARQKAYLFCSVALESLKTGSLLRQYLEFAINAGSEFSRCEITPAVDAFREEVCDWLEANGITVWKGYSVAGFNMDIVCRAGDSVLAIDLVGFPGELADFHRLERFALFQRAGLQVYPLTFGSWCLAGDRCRAEILELLDGVVVVGHA